MTQIIDGKKIQNEILADIKARVAELGFKPIFCDVLVGDDSVSRQYVQMKMRRAESVGMQAHPVFFPATGTTEELVQEIQKINSMPNICGLIIQLPLPLHIDKHAVLDAIDPALDVDCLGTAAREKFYSGFTAGGPPAALACMRLLDSVGMDLNNKNIAVLGQGDLVGKPVTALLKFRNAQPVTIDRATLHQEDAIKKADVLITGIGHGNYVRGDMIKRGAVIIDAGTSEDGKSVVGDVDFESVQGIADYVSPVPGGVGPVAVATLLRNVLTVAQMKNKTELK